MVKEGLLFEEPTGDGQKKAKPHYFVFPGCGSKIEDRLSLARARQEAKAARELERLNADREALAEAVDNAWRQQPPDLDVGEWHEEDLEPTPGEDSEPCEDSEPAGSFSKMGDNTAHVLGLVLADKQLSVQVNFLKDQTISGSWVLTDIKPFKNQRLEELIARAESLVECFGIRWLTDHEIARTLNVPMKQVREMIKDGSFRGNGQSPVSWQVVPPDDMMRL
jgi:hypothetical protein